MENDTLPKIIFATGSGFLMAYFYLKVLWWSLKDLQTTPAPQLKLMAGFVVRMGTMAVSLWLLGQIGWLYILWAIAGFFVMRFKLVRDQLEPHETERNIKSFGS